MTDHEQILQLLYRFEDAGLVSKNIENVIGCFAKQIIGIGMGEQGLVKSLEDVRRVIETGLKQDDQAIHSLEYKWVEILIQDKSFAVVCAEIVVISQGPEASAAVRRSKLLQSLSVVKEEGEWKICGLHASTPIVTEESLEAYPLKFAEETLQSLREKIGEEVYLTEEQYRQAILADTVAFYIINFTLGIFEKCQLNCDWCAYTDPNTPYEKFIGEKVIEYLCEEDQPVYVQQFALETVQRAFADQLKELTCEYRMKLPDGSLLWVCSILRLITDVATGHQKGIMYVKNIDQAKQAEQMILNRATYDEMTGVYHKGMMIRCMTDYLNGAGGVFIMLDVDDFKDVNDAFGHPVGDQVLIAVARKLKESFPAPALIGRMGGDEFGVFIPGEMVSAALRAKLPELLASIGQKEIYEHVSITCSIGVAHCQPGTSFDTLYKRSDEALYLSKKTGKNRVTFI